MPVKKATPRDPFEPFATVIGIGAALALAGFIVSLLGPLLGWGHFYGLGEQTACVASDQPFGALDGQRPAAVRPGVAVSHVGSSLCADHATWKQQMLDTLTQIP